MSVQSLQVELADEDVGEFVEALDRAAFGGGGSGLDALVAVVVRAVDDFVAGSQRRTTWAAPSDAVAPWWA